MTASPCPDTRVARLRKRLGWSQQKLAREIGVAQSTIDRMEGGQAESRPVAKLLDQLEASFPSGAASPGAPAESASLGPAAASSTSPAAGPLSAPDSQFAGFASAHGD